MAESAAAAVAGAPGAPFPPASWAAMALAWMDRLTTIDEEMEAKRLSVQRAMQQNQQPNPPANAPRIRHSLLCTVYVRTGDHCLCPAVL
jgi:hypothetical protein